MDYNGYSPRAFVTKEDMTAHLSERRYRGNHNEKDTAYIAFVEDCLKLTDNSILGIGTNLESAMGDPGHKEYQDPQNTLGGMTDVYRDMSEARKDQASPLYKESAFERQRVMEKIGRSVPDEAVSFEKRQASVQFIGEESGPDAPASLDQPTGEGE